MVGTPAIFSVFCFDLHVLTMVGILTIISVLGLYVEVVMQLCDLFSNTHDSLEFPITVVVTSVLVVSFLITNLASLILAFRCSRIKERASEKTVCVVLHSVQLGLVWRAYRVLFRYNKGEWLHFTGLRLIYPSLLTFLYLVLQGRLLFVPGHQIGPLQVLSLVVSLASATMALCSYILRHKLHEALMLEGLPGNFSGRLRHAGVATLLLGTFLCLTTRLGSFTLLSAQHGFWVFFPFCVHFFAQAAIRLSCSRLSSHKASVDSGGCILLLQEVATSYLNTLELVEEDLRRIQCRYVLFYSLVLVENLAMTATWLLQSPLDYTVKLLVVVGLLSAFLVALVLKFVSCGCIAAQGAEGSSDTPGVTSSVDSPRSLTAPPECEARRSGNRGSGKWSITSRDYSRTAGPFRAGKEFHTSTPRDKSNESASLATICSQTNDVSYYGDRRLNRKRGRRHTSFSNSRTTSTILSDSTINKAPKEEQNASHEDKQSRKKQGDGDTRPKHSQQLSSSEHGLVTEDNQHHLQDLAKHSELSDAVWLASLALCSDQHDACSFDDPILASRLVMESLGHPRHPSSQRTSSSKSKHKRSDRSSNDGRVSREKSPYPATSVEGLGFYGETMPEKLRKSTASRNEVGSGSCERHSDEVQYRYWTRCSCRGSPSSTPRRRPAKQRSSRKTQSHASAHHSHHRAHRGSRMHHRNATRRTDTRHSPSLREKIRVSTISQNDSRLADYARSSLRRSGKPPLPSPRFDDDVYSSSIVSQESSRHHWSLCHHHGNDGSDRPATWPRKGERSAHANSSVTTSHALPDDAVRTQDVVRLWLRGLETSGLHHDLDPQLTVHSEDEPAARVCGVHFGHTHSEDTDDCTDCSMRVKLDDDDDDDDDDDNVVLGSAKQNLQYSNLHPNDGKSCLNSFQQRREYNNDAHRSHSGLYMDSTRHASDRPGPAVERKDSRSLVNIQSAQVTASPLTSRQQASPRREQNSRISVHQQHDSQAPRQHSLHQNYPHVITADSLYSHNDRWKAVAHDLKRREMLSRSNGHGHVFRSQVVDSGISISTVPDSDGSRSNAQGYIHVSTVQDSDASRSNAKGYTSRSKPSGADLSTETLSDRSWSKSRPQTKGPPNLQHLSGPQQSSVQQPSNSVHSENEHDQRNVVTLDVDESLV